MVTKIGDIFHSTWGYDMTQNDYYQVVDITPSGKSVKVRKLDSERIYTEFQQGKEMPIKDKFDRFEPKVITKRLLESYDGQTIIKIKSWEWAKLWDGQANIFNYLD